MPFELHAADSGRRLTISIARAQAMSIETFGSEESKLVTNVPPSNHWEPSSYGTVVCS